MLRRAISKLVLSQPVPNVVSTRNTYILRRKYTPRLVGKTGPKTLKRKEHIYILEERTELTRAPDLELVLTQFVEGFGSKGDVVSVRPGVGRSQLLLPGYAKYATPEIVAEYKLKKQDEPDEYSTPHIPTIIRMLQCRLFYLPMSATEPWTIEPWHIRVALRLASVVVHDERIRLPETPISGPDPVKDEKDFAVFIRVDDPDKEIPIRFRITHVKPNEIPKVQPENIELDVKYDFEEPREALFPEQAGIVAELQAALEKDLQRTRNILAAKL